MAFTFSVKKWRKERPSSGKGLGVAEAITALEKASGTPVGRMAADEVKTAQAAVKDMLDAFGKAKTEIKKSKDDQSVISSIDTWMKECRDYQEELSRRVYGISVEKLQAKYDESFDYNRTEFLKAYAAGRSAFQAFQRDGVTVPPESQIQKWMGSIRDMAKMASKQGPAEITIPEAKSVRVTDIRQPADVKQIKTQIAELSAWCDAFAKEVRRRAKTLGNSLDDSKAIEKELKEILAEYQKISRDNKQLVATAKQLAGTANQLADRVKQEIGVGNTDHRLFTQIGTLIKTTTKSVSDTRAAVETLHQTYREGGGVLARRQKSFRAMEGYDQKTHGAIIEKAQSNVQIGIRLATLPLGEAERQLDRARRFMTESTNHRGYL
jgi:chaperonin cofactor prefoldin